MTYEIEIKITDLDEQTYNRLMDEFKNLKNSEVIGKPVLNKADCSVQLPPSNDDEYLCRSCKRPMDEDEGRWGWCGDCYEN